MSATATAYQRRATEAEMREAITKLVALRGGRLWFVRDSRQSPETEDMPDLLILLPGLAAWIELKSQRRRITPGQREVAVLLDGVERFVGGVVRPESREGEMSYDELLTTLEEAVEG